MAARRLRCLPFLNLHRIQTVGKRLVWRRFPLNPNVLRRVALREPGILKNSREQVILKI